MLLGCNRKDKLGLWANMSLAVASALIGNAIIFAMGWNRQPEEIYPSFAPPGWAIGAIWVVLFAAMGAARWLLVKAGDTAHARGVTYLLINCFLYPYYTSGLQSGWVGLAGDILTIAIASVLIIRTAKTTPRAAALLALVLAWALFAAVLIISLLQLNP